MSIGRVTTTLTIIINSFTVLAQSNSQLWFEYIGEFPFANSYLFRNGVTYNTTLNTPKWQAFDYTPTFEYALSQYIDLIVAATFSYVKQTSNYNSFEIRPSLGTRIHFTPNRRVHVRLLARIEQRNFNNLETGMKILGHDFVLNQSYH
jgi:hypothetical protein